MYTAYYVAWVKNAFVSSNARWDGRCGLVSVSVDNTDTQSNYSDMYTALLERRQILEQQLGRKLQQLRRVCLEEAVCHCIHMLTLV